MSNLKTPNKEIERKFLVDINKWNNLYSTFNKKTNFGTRIVQFYLSNNPTVRIRISGLQAFITIKGPTEGISRSEFEYRIPREDAEEMMKLGISSFIEKIRYDVEFNNQLFTVDVFEGKNKGLVIAEIELESEDQEVILPDWITEDVSEDINYYNSNLAENPFTEWNRSGYKFRVTHS